MNLDMKLKFNFNKRNKYKNICSIEGCNNSACGKYCNKHYHQIKRYGHIKTHTRFDNRFRTTKNTEAFVFENGGFVGNLGLVKKLWKKYTEAIYKYRTNTGKMTASDYTHLFGYLNPYYRSAYNIPKRRK